MLTLTNSPTEAAYPRQPTTEPANSTRGARRWVGTWNNYGEDDINALQTTTTARLSLQWGILSKETAPSTGTKHLQIYLVFKNCIKFTTLRNLFPNVWWAPAKGNNKENYLYVTKTRPDRTDSQGNEIPADEPNLEEDIFEWGQRPNLDALLDGMHACINFIDYRLSTICYYPIETCENCTICNVHYDDFQQTINAAYTLLDMYKDECACDCL